MPFLILSQKLDEAITSRAVQALAFARRAAWKVAVGSPFISYALYPQETQLAVLAAGGLGVIGSGYWLTDWALSFPHRRNWVYPLHVTLKEPLRLDDGVRAVRYIKVPRDYTKREDVGKIMLPKAYAGVETKAVETIIKNKLGLSDCQVTFKMAGRHPHVVIRQTPRPPAKVMFRDVTSKVIAAHESAPLLGIGPQGRQVAVDLDAESPHILVNASTGGGKSVILRTTVAQMLHNGAQGVVLDFKRHSHKWARSLPQVDYRRDIHEIHEALVALGREGHRRNKIVDDWEGEEGQEPVGPRLAILLEEANATVGKLKRYWTATRDKSDPKESPAIDALREILFMGRAVKMHVLLVAQSATAAALGGPEVRECFAVRILSRYTQNAWRMLVPEVHPIPRSTRHVGRAQVVLGGTATETQIVFMTTQEATEWAMCGIVAPPPNLSRDMRAPSPTRENVRDVTENVTPELTLIKGGMTMTLAAAARNEVVPMSADALRQAKRRDPNFPAGTDGRWTADELITWYRNRSA